MKYIFLLLISVTLSTRLSAQDNDLQLARQYTQTGETQKAADIYQRLYRQDNEAFFQPYADVLISLKKLDEAENITKKILRKHPAESQYAIMLGKIYTEQGHPEKASEVYAELVKKLPPDPASISSLATQFYQVGDIDQATNILKEGRKLLRNDRLFAMELISLYRMKRDKPGVTDEYLNFLPDNPVYLNQAENVLASLYEGTADYDLLRSALLRRLQKDPQQIVYSGLLTWLYLQQKEFDQALNQAMALDRRQHKGSGNDVFELCRVLAANEAYDTSIRGYEYLLTRNKPTDDLYIPTKIELVNVKASKITSGKYTQADLLSLEKDYQALLNEFGKNAGTAFAMQKLANLQAFKLHKLNDAQKLLEEAMGITNMRPQLYANCKLDLGDVYLMNGLPWEATLIYSQVEKANAGTPIAQDANYRNAKLAYYTGDLQYAKAQLNVLKAATSQLIANDALNLSLLISDQLAVDTAGKALKQYARADLEIFKERPEKAMMILDSIDQKYPGDPLSDDIMMAKARIYLQQKNYPLAITQLKRIVADHPNDLWADDAIYMLGTIYEDQLHEPATAKDYFQKIITDHPGSIWIGEARKHFRSLRGDKPDTSP
ncbi:tetratricopeptide repeat protein [Mucilaginibacter daejeonensis]|uniref:tetratricopeptide repeat protein n=1 Tax=Mucilaginibacter daejeonensis TaxID=398049 RepID=UPI001D17C513|nr:tetratricopeptide repeat protein [Mucilaginibacter daejeonensis]UEG53977.1 tetratricopeptide repeat protein [Mucilaginibacter daejeonensis]